MPRMISEQEYNKFLGGEFPISYGQFQQIVGSQQQQAGYGDYTTGAGSAGGTTGFGGDLAQWEYKQTAIPELQSNIESNLKRWYKAGSPDWWTERRLIPELNAAFPELAEEEIARYVYALRAKYEPYEITSGEARQMRVRQKFQRGISAVQKKRGVFRKPQKAQRRVRISVPATVRTSQRTSPRMKRVLRGGGLPTF